MNEQLQRAIPIPAAADSMNGLPQQQVTMIESASTDRMAAGRTCTTEEPVITSSQQQYKPMHEAVLQKSSSENNLTIVTDDATDSSTTSSSSSDENENDYDKYHTISIRRESYGVLMDCPRILTNNMMKELRYYGMPKVLHQYTWELCYSLGFHGDSFVTILNQCKPGRCHPSCGG